MGQTLYWSTGITYSSVYEPMGVRDNSRGDVYSLAIRHGCYTESRENLRVMERKFSAKRVENPNDIRTYVISPIRQGARYR